MQTFEKPLWNTPQVNLVDLFFLLVICVHAIYQCDPLVTQEQEFPKIWDLYSKIDNNIKSTFSA